MKAIKINRDELIQHLNNMNLNKVEVQLGWYSFFIDHENTSFRVLRIWHHGNEYDQKVFNKLDTEDVVKLIDMNETNRAYLKYL